MNWEAAPYLSETGELVWMRDVPVGRGRCLECGWPLTDPVAHDCYTDEKLVLRGPA